jgi:tyrosyl-tRNA synthetase
LHDTTILQYFLKVADADVEKYLKLFTFLPLEEIKSIVLAHATNPEKRMAQYRLASEVTEMVHESESDLSLELWHAHSASQKLASIAQQL